MFTMWDTAVHADDTCKNVSESFLKWVTNNVCFGPFCIFSPIALPPSERKLPLEFCNDCCVWCMHVSLLMEGEGELCAHGECACPHLCMWKPEVEVRSLSQSQDRGGFLTAPEPPHGPCWQVSSGSAYYHFPVLTTGACGHGCRDLNSGPHAHKAGTLLPEPSPRATVYC